MTLVLLVQGIDQGETAAAWDDIGGLAEQKQVLRAPRAAAASESAAAWAPYLRGGGWGGGAFCGDSFLRERGGELACWARLCSYDRRESPADEDGRVTSRRLGQVGAAIESGRAGPRSDGRGVSSAGGETGGGRAGRRVTGWEKPPDACHATLERHVTLHLYATSRRRCWTRCCSRRASPPSSARPRSGALPG